MRDIGDLKIIESRQNSSYSQHNVLNQSWNKIS
jgi:hypothetical protein